MAETRRLTGTGRLKTIFEAMDCCRIKLLNWDSAQLSNKSQEVYSRPQNTRIGRQASNRNPDVVVDAVHLLLVGRELTRRTLHSR